MQNELANAVSDLDADNSGELDFSEFYPWYCELAKAKQEATREDTERYIENRRLSVSAADTSPFEQVIVSEGNEDEDNISLRAKLIAVAKEYNLPEEDVLRKFC